jgi:CDP-glucose 4,6-dehydratase
MAEIDSSFWDQKRVLVTGHTGFKGGWLCLILQLLNSKIFGISLDPPTNPNLYEVAQIANGIESFRADVRDLVRLKELLALTKPEIVFHMAAQPLVRASYLDPVETYSTNVMGTVALLEACRQTESVKTIVVITSDKCYENREWVWSYRESDSMGGYDPYSSSKGCTELVSHAYWSSFFSDPKTNSPALATARAGNVIGGGDWAHDRLLPDILNAFREGRAAKIRNPNSVRPWQHVLDPLSGYVMLAQHLSDRPCTKSEGWNFGPNPSEESSVESVAQKAVDRWGGGVRLDLKGASDQVHEAATLRLDISKAKSILGWKPKISLEYAIELTVAWEKSRLEGKSMRDYTVNQIKEYLGDSSK